jgi:hypothetical protein
VGYESVLFVRILFGLLCFVYGILNVVCCDFKRIARTWEVSDFGFGVSCDFGMNLSLASVLHGDDAQGEAFGFR